MPLVAQSPLAAFRRGQFLSVAAHYPQKGLFMASAAAKAGLESLIRTLASEHAARGNPGQCGRAGLYREGWRPIPR